ncbi:MAG UNVERIFIED_CONTAM: WecB/TagA/CpsF family glycosyltransferase [Microcystis novacekii LVE1205-3]|jgi:N-acetylglucosaminyldiphosphoundecaprenol N-acetyl-beta-D-mannosaminyltransferase
MECLLVWGLRLLGIKQQSRVYGRVSYVSLLRATVPCQIPIYLYGATEKTLIHLQANLKQRFPDLIIAGSYSPFSSPQRR